MRLKSQHSPFEALVESIIYQQIHGKAAFAILSRLLRAFGDIHPQPDTFLAAPEEMLRACGLSANKMKALRDLAAKTLDGTVPTLARIRRMSRRGDRRAADTGARRRPVDGGDAADLPPGPAGYFSGERLRRAQGLSADLRASAEVQADHAGGIAQARRDAAPREEVAALALGRKLVSVASMRPGRQRFAASGIAIQNPAGECNDVRRSDRRRRASRSVSRL